MFCTTLFALRSGLSDGYSAVVIVQAGVFAEVSRQLVRYIFMSKITMACSLNSIGLYRVAAQLELDFNSVERIVEYLEVPEERPAIIEDHRPPAYWPSSNGDITVDNLVVRYAPELPAVLKNLTFVIKPMEKIGVVSECLSPWGSGLICTSRWAGREAESRPLHFLCCEWLRQAKGEFGGVIGCDAPYCLC